MCNFRKPLTMFEIQFGNHYRKSVNEIICNCQKPLTIIAKNFILDVVSGPESISTYIAVLLRNEAPTVNL